MPRKLRHHEQKLLRKVDFHTYASDASHRAAAVSRRYAIQKPADYAAYNRVCGQLRQLAHKLSELDAADPFRLKYEDLMLGKLAEMGIVKGGVAGAAREGEEASGKVVGGAKGLSEVEKVSVSAFARRRLPVVMTRLGMGETVQAAIKFIEQGHVRVGPEVITDPAFLVTRNMEDFVTWVDSSKIKRNILRYRDKLDDFDLL
ncbi:MAG: hypothetical protein M1819_000972 [Sarea resinae]|nr:MAG: hypothetical protein M1819_000972 [Sarea resinae]